METFRRYIPKSALEELKAELAEQTVEQTAPEKTSVQPGDHGPVQTEGVAGLPITDEAEPPKGDGGASVRPSDAASDQ